MSESEPLRAIVLRYEGVHFLINRNQCGSSHFVPAPPEPGPRRRYLRESLRSGASRLLLFDLDLFLRESFRLESKAQAKLALVAGLAAFGESTRNLLSRSVFPRFRLAALDTERIAFRVPGSATMRDIPVEDLEPNGSSVRGPLVGHGILALHLAGESMGFLLDLDRLVGSGPMLANGEGL